MNYKMIRYTIGLILKFEAIFFIIPTITALIYSEWQPLLAVLASAAICLAFGIPLSWRKPRDMKLYARDGFVIVALSWIALSMFGALPFFISREIPNYIDALFETVSGFTTTGSSIVPNIELMSKSLVIWRSFTHWVGGMGVLVFVMAILPLSGAQNMHIMRAESPGPEVSKLVPRVKKTAMILYLIYFVLTVIAFICLMLDNVVNADCANKIPVFDALCTTFGVAGTGGFGIKVDSMNGYTPYVQIICTVFLLVFSINFNSYYLILKAKFKDALNSEVKAFLVIVLVAITAIAVNIRIEGAVGAETTADAVRNSAFTVASIISTAGFSTANFNLWPEFSKTIIILIMFIGACAGSTGGGIKVSRIIILFKGMVRELGQLINPKRVKKITIDRKPVDNELVRTVNAYLVTFVLIFVGSIILLSFDNYVDLDPTHSSLVTNFTAVATAINNVGPGLDMVGPDGSFANFSYLSKSVLIFDMLAGRLELFPMLLLFSPSTWMAGSRTGRGEKRISVQIGVNSNDESDNEQSPTDFRAKHANDYAIELPSDPELDDRAGKQIREGRIVEKIRSVKTTLRSEVKQRRSGMEADTHQTAKKRNTKTAQETMAAASEMASHEQTDKQKQRRAAATSGTASESAKTKKETKAEKTVKATKTATANNGENGKQ